MVDRSEAFVSEHPLSNLVQLILNEGSTMGCGDEGVNVSKGLIMNIVVDKELELCQEVVGNELHDAQLL